MCKLACVFVCAFQVEDVNSEANRMSRCLSLASFPSSDAGLADVDTREQENIKQVKRQTTELQKKKVTSTGSREVTPLI